MKKILLTALLSGLVGTASAQSAFEGFYGQIATGYENNTRKGTNTTFKNAAGATLATYSDPAAIANSVPIVIGAGYNFSITPQFLLGIGADYSLLTAKTALTTSTSPGAANNESYDKISNRYNIFVTPGYVIDKNKLAYLKAGYSSQKVAGYSDDGTAGPSVNLNGYILGLGYKQMISNGLYVFGEGNYMGYMSKTATFAASGTNTGSTPMSASAFNFLIGVGYKF